MVILFLFYAAPLLLFLCLCTLLGIWLAVGQTHVSIRMPVFLVGILALGVELAFAVEDVHPSRFIFCITESGGAKAYAVGFLLMAILFEPTIPLFGRILAFVLGACMTVAMIFHGFANGLDPGWIVRVALGSALLSGVVGILHVLGFSVINLTDGVSNREIDMKTGHDWDEWFVILHAHNAESLNRAETMAFLRRYNLEYPWQKLVAAAYERATGRGPIESSSGGKGQVVVHTNDCEMAKPWTHSAQPRFTVGEWMRFIFCACALLAFVRMFGAFRPTTEDLRYGIPTVLGASVFALLAVRACLSIRRLRQRLAFASWAAVATACAVLCAMRIGPNHPAYLCLLASMLGYAGLLTLSLMLIRNQGYRLVHVQPQTSSDSLPCTGKA